MSGTIGAGCNVHNEEALDEVGSMERQVHRRFSAHRMAEYGSRSDLHVGHGLDNVRGQLIVTHFMCVTRQAVIAQIEGNDLIFVRQ